MQPMQLHAIRGGTKEELEAHRYNIGVGISLGNKWFSVENTVKAAKWALDHTKEFVVIYVADSIHAINLEVRNRIPHERALRIATQRGREFLEVVEQETKRLLPEEVSRVIFATWNDIDTPEYRKKVEYLYAFYEQDENFKLHIKNIVRNWTSKEIRIFSEEEITKFGTYILEELPEVIGRVPIKGIVYEAYTYPYDGELTKFVEQLQKAELFPQIKENLLDAPPKVFLEVR